MVVEEKNNLSGPPRKHERKNSRKNNIHVFSCFPVFVLS
jgi:hypothetical protein